MNYFTSKIQIEDNLIAGYTEELSILQNNRHLGTDTEAVSLEKLQNAVLKVNFNQISELMKSVVLP